MAKRTKMTEQHRRVGGPRHPMEQPALREAETRLEPHPRPASIDVPSGPDTEAQAKKAFLEREIRRYVKRTGGVRANMCKADCQRAQELIDQWNDKYPGEPREIKDGWLNVHVPHYDNADHAMNQKNVKPRYGRVVVPHRQREDRQAALPQGKDGADA